MAANAAEPESSSGFLGLIERVGNKVPHPVLMFVYLIAFVMVLSLVLSLLNVSVTEEMAVPIASSTETTSMGYYEDTVEPSVMAPVEPYATQYEIKEVTTPIRNLISIEGIRFIFTSFVPNFAGFSVVAVVLIAMLGAGVAESAGLMGALIRKLVEVAPAPILCYLLIFVGVLSSVASDAGYLILIPLAGAAFLSVGRHPLAGVAAAFAGVGAIFGVNLLLTPSDAMITEITNEAIGLFGGQPITIVNNYFFAIVASLLLTVVAGLVTEKMIEPRLGKYAAEDADEETETVPAIDKAAEERGLQGALRWTLGALVFVLLITLPPGAPLREPGTGAIIGQTPFMDSLLFVITLLFLCAGIGFGFAAGTFTHANDVIAAIAKTWSSLAGLLVMFLMIAQFIALFNWSNMPTVVAVALADLLERANFPALPLLVGLILVIMLLDIILPGLIPKWAIFAPVFVPLFYRLGITPQTVLAAYRVGDSPLNVVTPLMVYLPFVLTIIQRYNKKAGMGTLLSLMIPYTVIIAVTWIILYIVWFLVGIPWGPGYPVNF